MSKTRLALLMACALLLAASTVATADNVTQSKDFKLSNVEPRDALVILRSIGGTRDVDIVEPDTITVRDTTENLAVAEIVLKMVDASSGAPQEASPTPQERVPERFLVPVSDGSVIASVGLQHAAAKDVLSALRTKLQIRRIATLADSRVFFRDTEDQVKATLELIRQLDVPE